MKRCLWIPALALSLAGPGPGRALAEPGYRSPTHIVLSPDGRLLYVSRRHAGDAAAI